jgi:threonine/homoserine/homoserine lactone efflux protein
MPEWHTLLLFSVAVLGLLITPGPSMAFLFAHSLASGPRGGLAVATGILLSDLVMSALTAAGVTGLIVALPGSLDAIRLVGAAYLLWLAAKALRPQAAGAVTVAARLPFAAVMRQSLVNSLLNPKAFLFFVVFIPQFVDPARGRLPMQLAVLGMVLALEAWSFHAVLGLVSGSLATRLQGARLRTHLSRLQALVFVALALRLLLA